MGDFKSELLKSGLVSDKHAKRVSHEEKARKKKKGRAQVTQEQEEHEASRRARERARRDADRERELARRQLDEQQSGRFRVAQLIDSHALRTGIRGPRRFHFVARDRTIPFLSLNEQTTSLLEEGRAAICEVPDTTPVEFAVIPSDTANQLRELAPELVLFYERS